MMYKLGYSAALLALFCSSVFGQNDLVVEYWPENIPTTRFVQHEDRLEISISRAQRLYNNKVWANPIVVKFTNVEFVGEQSDR
jgi:alpha-L-fucosidase